MKRPTLMVEKRKIFAKKLKKLRQEGILPANIYGKDIKSVAVQVPYKEFEKVYKEAGETKLIDVQVDDELKPSLIHNVQRDYLNNINLHADFYQVNLKEKVKTMVPILVTGTAKAVTDKLGLLLQPLSQIEVEALPEDLPENIEVNVDSLANVNDQITVANIKTPQDVTILTSKEQVIAKIGELVSKEAQAQAAAEAAAVQAAKAASIAATSAEGVKPEGAEAPTEAAKEAQPKVAGEKPAAESQKPPPLPSQKKQAKTGEKPQE